MTRDLSKNTIIAPMATAIWLIDNTSLSFQQIGNFCDFTEAEVKLMADGVIGNGVLPLDPTKNGNLTAEEIYNREQDGGDLHNAFSAFEGVNINIQKKKKYIPMIQRRRRPEAILWLVNYCKELTDAQIISLVRTTKSMVQNIRNKTYAGYNDLVPKDPVILGFCSQKNLNHEIEIAKAKEMKNLEKEQKETTKKNKKVVKKINVNTVKVEKTKNKVTSKKSVKKTVKPNKQTVKKSSTVKADNKKSNKNKDSKKTTSK